MSRSAMTAVAATGSLVGSFSDDARSLPVPAGTIPSGVSVPATALMARWAMPSPPSATTASTPSATAFWASASASSASCPIRMLTFAPACFSRAATLATTFVARPLPAVGLTRSATSAVAEPVTERQVHRRRSARARRRPDPGRSSTPRRATRRSCSVAMPTADAVEQTHRDRERTHRERILARRRDGGEHEDREDDRPRVQWRSRSAETTPTMLSMTTARGNSKDTEKISTIATTNDR